MYAAHADRSLARRLSEQYLLFGLAGLFAFVITAIYLTWQESLLNFMPGLCAFHLG